MRISLCWHCKCILEIQDRYLSKKEKDLLKFFNNSISAIHSIVKTNKDEDFILTYSLCPHCIDKESVGSLADSLINLIKTEDVLFTLTDGEDCSICKYNKASNPEDEVECIRGSSNEIDYCKPAIDYSRVKIITDFIYQNLLDDANIENWMIAKESLSEQIIKELKQRNLEQIIRDTYYNSQGAELIGLLLKKEKKPPKLKKRPKYGERRYK